MHYLPKHRVKATKRPDGEKLVKGTIMSKDGKTPANVYHLKEGNRIEIKELLNFPRYLEKADKTMKKRLVFIVVAGHGTCSFSDQIYFDGLFDKNTVYGEV